MILNVYGIDVPIDDKIANQLANLGHPLRSKTYELYLKQDGITSKNTDKESIISKVTQLVKEELEAGLIINEQFAAGKL